jgi:hypothetical protein
MHTTSIFKPQTLSNKPKPPKTTQLKDVSVVDLTVVLEKPAKYDDVMAELKKASEGAMKGVLGCVRFFLVCVLFRNASNDLVARLWLRRFAVIDWEGNGHTITPPRTNTSPTP